MRRRTLLEDSGKINYQEVDLGGSVLWASQNIGASGETDYGLYFSWGETEGYVDAASKINKGGIGFTWGSYEHITGTSANANALTKYNSTDGKTVLDLEDDAASVNMGGKWRMPTHAEFLELIDNTTSTWETNYNGTGVKGRLFTSISNPNIKLFFPAAGYCDYFTVNSTGSSGYYWSSSLLTSDRLDGRYLYSRSLSVSVVNNHRYYGYSVRGVKDKPIEFSLSETGSTQEYLGGATSFRVLVNSATYTVDSKITVTSNQSWATTSLSNGVITINFTKNTSTSSTRSAVITVSVGALSEEKTYTLTQQTFPSGAKSGSQAPVLSVLFVNDTNTNEKYCFEEANWPDSGWTPIGVVVVPASHERYSNSQCGVMSLKAMGRSPVNGSTSNSTCAFGLYGVYVINQFHGSSALTTSFSDKIPYQTNSSSTAVTASSSALLWPYGGTTTAPTTVASTTYHNTAGNYVQSKSGKAGCDFNGLRNTVAIYLQTSGSSAWTSSSVALSDSSKYSAPTVCAGRYKTKGTKSFYEEYSGITSFNDKYGTSGSPKTNTSVWYLPAEGELCYIPRYRHSINNTITALKSKYGSSVAASLMVDEGLWSSSSENNSYYSSEYYVFLGGSLIPANKTSNTIYARAFMRF